MNEPQVSKDNINNDNQQATAPQQPIHSHSVNMLILYFVCSLGLGIFTEDMQMKTLVYAIKIALEIIAIFVLTFTQMKTMKDEKFPFKKLLPINFTVWVFAKIICYAVHTLRAGHISKHGYALFWIFQVVYHSAEFLFTVTCHPTNVSWDSFLINHSTAYTIAQIVCHVEYWIEVYFFPAMKTEMILIVIGVIILFFGHLFRISAFYFARSNFTHLIQDEKRPTHRLVTHGIYKISRHPSYLGWFMSTLGGQILLGNPISGVGFTLVSWKFFLDRIMYEEYTLYKFFGNDYIEYMNKTPIGIPFLQHFINKARRKNS